MYGYIEIVVNGENNTYFSNSIENNIIIYTDEIDQNILIGPSPPKYSLSLSDNYIKINDNIKLNFNTNISKNYLNTNIIFPAGSIIPYPKTIINNSDSTLPSGWLLCNGDLLNNTSYPNLFEAICYIYGGNGLFFNIPNLKGVYLRGLSSTQHSLTTVTTLQNTSSGIINTTLTENNILSHSHDFTNTTNILSESHTHQYSSVSTPANSTLPHSHRIQTATNTVSSAHSHNSSVTDSAKSTHTHSATPGSYSHTHSTTTSYGTPRMAGANNQLGNTVSTGADGRLHASSSSSSTVNATVNATAAADGAHNHGSVSSTTANDGSIHSHQINAADIGSFSGFTHTHQIITNTVNTGILQSTNNHTHIIHPGTTDYAGGVSQPLPFKILPNTLIMSYLIKY